MQTTEQRESAQHDIERLQALYRAGFHDDFLNRALRKIIEQQIAQDTANLAQISQDLHQFERQYHLSSDEFWGRYQAGKMADTADFLEWHVFCTMRQRILARLHILQGGNADEHYCHIPE